ncbi:MAG: DUF3575 domain-containing protein [Bacteroidota bacterium]
MKHYIVFFIALAMAQMEVTAQQQMGMKEHQHCIKINLLSPIMSTVNLAFETNIGSDKSFQLGFAFMDHSTYGTTDGVTKAYFLTPEFRYRLVEYKNGYSFIGAFGRYIHMQYSQTDKYRFDVKKSSSVYDCLGLGIILGQKFIYRDRVVIEMFAGPVYSGIVQSKNDFYNRAESDINLDEDIPHTLLKRYGVRAGLNVGWMF